MNLQPLCAQPCISSAMLAVGCKYNDQSCGCKSNVIDSIGNLAASCLLQNCPATQMADIVNAGIAGCSAYSLTYMYSNGVSTMASTTISLTSSFPSSTPTLSSSGSVVRVTGSTMSTPTSQAETSIPNPMPQPISKLSTASTVAIGFGTLTIICTIVLAIICCLRHRRANFRQIRKSDSELFALIGTHELDSKSIRHEVLDQPASKVDHYYIRPASGMYELPSETNTEESLLREQNAAGRISVANQESGEESLLREPTPPPRVATPDQKKGQPPVIIVHLAEEAQRPESIRKPRRLRKMERISQLRE